MRKIYLYLGILCLVASINTSAAPIPFSPEADARFIKIENMSGDASFSSSTGVLSVNNDTVRQMKTAQYIFGTHGGSIGDKSLSVSVPALGVITKVTLKVDTAFVAASTANISFGCAGRGIATLFTAQPLGSAVNAVLNGAIQPSGSVGFTSGALALGASTCDIIANIAGATGNYTAGAATLWVEYLQGN